MTSSWILFLLSSLVLIEQSCGHYQQRLGQVAAIHNPTVQLLHWTTQDSLTKRSTLRHYSQLQHDDSFLLQFMAYDQSFTIQLAPNSDLFHPIATETILRPDGTETVRLIAPEQFRVYKGHVVPSASTLDLPNVDHWARITVRHDIQHDHPYPLFEGAFAFEGDIYHIHTNTNYHLFKRSGDPHLPDHWPMVIYRDSDLNDDHDSDDDDDIYSTAIGNDFTTLPILTSRDLQHHRANPYQNRTSYYHDDVMCAMEEMTYNRKLTGARPFWQSTHNQTSVQNNNNSDNDTINESNDDSESDSDSSDNDETSVDHPTQTPDVLWNKKKRSLVLPKMSKRDATLGQGCPNSRKIAFMGAAADCSYVKSYGGIRLAKIRMITDWNVASAVYERTFNISLGLIYMQMSTSQCPQQPSQLLNWNQDCSSYYTINNRLSDFSFWRGQRGDDQAALWHLMTKCSTGVKVGIAWLSQLCEFQASQQIEDNGSFDWVSGTGVSSITREEWKVVAHEIGHGFGAIHDCSAQLCACRSGCACCPLSPTKCSAGETYLMNPTSNVSTNDFSPCSITDVCSSFPNIGYCLKSPGDINNSTFSMCGNGILEPGEQCDPGRTDSPCCFAKNCTLKATAVCDDYSSQCCLNCNIAPKDTVCRPAASECDTEEVCTGLNSQCPADVYDPDGSPCANNTMQCASGVCTSRDEQCTARGLRLNISQQCPFQEDSCNISCADPSDPQNCLVLSGMFLDGTECGLAGFCRAGKCVGSGFTNTVRAWVNKNKNIAIPTFVFGGLFILALIALSIWYLLLRYRRMKLTSGKDKNSRPSSLASSRLDSTNDRTRGDNSDSGMDYYINQGRITNHSASIESKTDVPRRVNPFVNDSTNGNGGNSYKIDSGNNSSHSSITSQQTSTPGLSTTIDSSLQSESWELRTLGNVKQDIPRHHGRPTSSSLSLSSSPLPSSLSLQQQKACDVILSDLSTSPHLTANHTLRDNISYTNEDHLIAFNPFPVSRRSHHNPPMNINPTTEESLSANSKDLLSSPNYYDHEQPTIAMTTGSHRQASSNT